jgi:uncharacterized iron-regulated membrane protein
MKPRLRKLWLTLHRWLGLTAGLLFVLLGLTGSLLVFDHAIDEWLHPTLLLSQRNVPPRPLSELLAAAEEAMPEPVAAMSRPRIAGGVWTAWVQTGTDDEPQWTQVYVDPATAKVTGKRVWGTDLVGTVYRLHYTLLGGEWGETLVGIGGLLLMLSVVSGVYLWWPLLRNGWRAAFAIRSGIRFCYDLHKTLGIACSLVLLVIAFTGVYMIFPEWIKPIVAVVAQETREPKNLKTKATANHPRLSPEKVLAIAQRRFPDAQFDHFHPPLEKEGVYEMAFRQAGEIQRAFGRTQVWIDPGTGEILAVRDTRMATAADSFFASQFPLHNGEAFGLLGRWLVFFTGLAPAALYVTGLLLWWRKRTARRRQLATRAATEALTEVGESAMLPTQRLRSQPQDPAVSAKVR